MAKGKKSSGKTYTSTGTHSNVARNITNANRRDYMASGMRLINQRRAFEAGKNVVVTIPNPNPEEKNKPFIKVPAKEVWKLQPRYCMPL